MSKSGRLEEDAGGYPSPYRAAYLLGLLVLAILVAYVGRQVPTLLVGPIRSEFELTDSQIGLLQGFALNLCFGLASLPIAFLIDRSNRLRLIWIMGILWSAATALSGFSSEFWQLFLCRMVVGLAEAGLVPATYSLIADLYPERHRAKATLIYYAGSLIGASAGVALIGTGLNLLAVHKGALPAALQHLPDWRLAFLAAGATGLPLLVLLFGAREPMRQGVEPIAGKPASSGLGEHLKMHGVVIGRVIVGIVVMMVGVDALLTWTPAILTRTYGTSPGRAGEWLGLVWGLGSVMGVAMAGLLTVRLRASRGALAPLWIVRIGAVGSALVVTAFLFVGSISAYLLLLTLYFFAVFIAASMAPVLISSLAPNQVRGRVLALWVVASAITSAISPALVGLVSDALSDRPDGLRLAMCAVVIPCSLLAVLLLGARGNSARLPVYAS